MSQRFVITEDNRVLASGFEIGKVHFHPSLTSTHAPGKWFAVTDHGIVGLNTDRDRAVVAVAIDAGYPDAKLTDVDYEPSG